MFDPEQPPDILPQRLCNEIQLFDLCELTSCRYKSGRFCTDPALLVRFEKIAERELRVSERYLSEEIDETEEGDDDFADDDNDSDTDDGEEYDDREEY